MQFPENVTRLCSSQKFSFGCNPGLPCFTECCRELELLLTPYDVLRLCRELRLRASAFIDRHVVVEDDEKGGMPRLYLGMVDDGRASCPFVSRQGCRVYNGRPGACRAYPVGRGAMQDGGGRVREIYVLVREDHCCGFSEPGEFTVPEWFENQGLNTYNAVNDEVLGLLPHEQIRSVNGFSREDKDNYLLALYKLDEFRHLVSSRAFQEKYGLPEKERQAVLNDELELLRFGIRWLHKVLGSEK